MLCSCGNAYGQYGVSEGCTEQCPKPPTPHSDSAPRTKAIGSEVQLGQNVELCGNLLTNTVIYVFSGGLN